MYMFRIHINARRVYKLGGMTGVQVMTATLSLCCAIYHCDSFYTVYPCGSSYMYVPLP